MIQLFESLCVSVKLIHKNKKAPHDAGNQKKQGTGFTEVMNPANWELNESKLLNKGVIFCLKGIFHPHHGILSN